MENIIQKIVEQRKSDIARLGYNFGIEIPKKRTRQINNFMAQKGAILEVKRASPSKGDIMPNLDAVKTAIQYKKSGAAAISVLTEQNYFKGSLKDLIDVCAAVPDVPVLRKDFLLYEQEIEVAFLCGADAVLLIASLFDVENLQKMVKKCSELGIKALVEVRSVEEALKVNQVKEQFSETIICGVNSRNLRNFSIDLLYPASLKKLLCQNKNDKVIFESGIKSCETAKKIAAMGFYGILMGEQAAKNPTEAEKIVKSFLESNENLYGKKLIELSEKLILQKKENQPFVKFCGITNSKDAVFADSLGVDFLGFIFAPGFARNIVGENINRFREIQKVLPQINAIKVAVVTDLQSKECLQAIQAVKNAEIDFLQLHGINPNDLTEEIKSIPHYFAITKNNCKYIEEIIQNGEPRILCEEESEFLKNQNLWIAGGLNPENVKSVIKKFNPELVDVSSGIEDEVVGIKNHEKMIEFMKNGGKNV